MVSNQISFNYVVLLDSYAVAPINMGQVIYTDLIKLVYYY